MVVHIVWFLTKAWKGDGFLTRSCKSDWLLTRGDTLAAFVTSSKALSQPLRDEFMLSDTEAIRRCAHLCLCTASGCQCNRLLTWCGKCYRFFAKRGQCYRLLSGNCKCNRFLTRSNTLASQATYPGDFCHPFRNIFILPDANSIHGTALFSC